ncbi:hypothetical protein [Lampropedia aestuarii]|uniref:hypothetical protein n=1 Tax=Lampropedia aestuarii TaxID=2562762 RepID=UPI00246929D0|nr:hypothetical protein [Lampropedia aestuarii]
MEAIAALGRFVPPTNANFSKEFGYNFAIEGDFAIKEPPLTSFGTVEAPSRPDYVPSAVGRVAQIDFEKFEPGFSSITIPDAPEDRYFGDGPAAPVLDDVVLPNAPLLDKPLQPSLIDLEIPNFDFPELPKFNAQAPEFEGSSVSSVLQWKETPYEVSILGEEMAVLRRMWSGGTGLPVAVEQALWERAAEREDLGALREVSAAAIEFSGRGFTLPPGSLVRRVDAVRTEAELRKQSLGESTRVL